MSSVVLLVPILLLLATGSCHVASAHGTSKKPRSRIYRCYRENPANPTSAACKAAVAVSGAAGIEDWSNVTIVNAGGRHRQLIPDGHLCSAGLAKYAGLDLPRADWAATTLTSGVAYTFLYKAAVPHKGFFEFHVTKDGYDPTKPLKWSDLEATPFLNVTDPTLSNDDYLIPGVTPAGKSGRHLIYIIWQRSDKPGAYYSCSDVHFRDHHHHHHHQKK